jgi:acetamidase/formamidase
MPPDEAGMHDTRPPRFCGGNMDCKELVKGSTLYLPVPVSGALFSVGDGHAVQADGEVCGVAMECPMELVDLTFRLRDDLHLATPRANTPSGWITLGFHEDLNEASVIALVAMLDLLGEHYGLQRPEALALASLVVDFRITQFVNGVRGVHALLPHGAIR